MALSDQEVIAPAGASNGYASRDDWLSAAGKLKEEAHNVEGLGRLLLSEVTGEVRADLMTDVTSIALLPEGAPRKLDQKTYQKKVLLAGVVDPVSPVGDRNPLFKAGDMDKVMKIGGGKLAEVIDVIERLSGLGKYAGVAEKNSDTVSDAGTSA